MELSKQQQYIIENSVDKSVVMSSAASGKTRVLTEKVRQLLRDGVDPKEIAVITFTNMAASVLRERLGDDYKDGLFVGTIHSLANSFLLRAGISTGQYIKDEEFDRLFDLVVENRECVRNIQWVLLDEAQDSSPEQFSFIFDMIDPEHFFIVGDLKQSIYGFNGAKPKLLDNLSKRLDVTCFDMNENYRNRSNILSFAKQIIQQTGLRDNSVSMLDGNGRVAQRKFSYEAIVDYIKSEGEYRDWAVLVRYNASGNNICNYLKKNGIPCESFHQGDLTKKELQEKMDANTVKVLTVHSAKGLEWPNVIVTELNRQSSEELRVRYVAATRAKDFLVWMTGGVKKDTYRYERW